MKAIHIRWLIVVVMMLVLASCKSHVASDGPPNFYVDETKIADAHPKVEPLAKYGNMAHYYVFGKRYDTMKSCNNYEAIGTASWYGTKFHKRLTSSGEPYDMLGMTAAHKTLPLPTYVEVTNLANQRRVIVKVNDRGPFSGSRLIDLSYVAAKKLGMLGHGTAHVKIRAINPYSFGERLQFARHKPQMIHTIHQQNSVAIKKTYQVKQNHYALTQIEKIKTITTKKNVKLFLQVGAFKSRANAEKLQLSLSTQLVMPIHILMRNRLYRVQIGPIKDLATANHLTSQLKGLGIKSNINYGA